MACILDLYMLYAVSICPARWNDITNKQPFLMLVGAKFVQKWRISLHQKNNSIIRTRLNMEASDCRMAC